MLSYVQVFQQIVAHVLIAVASMVGFSYGIEALQITVGWLRRDSLEFK